MKTDYIDLVKSALADRLTISVWGGMEWQLRNSSSYTDIIAAIRSVDYCNVRLRCPYASRFPRTENPDLSPIIATVAIVHNGNKYENVCDWAEGRFNIENDIGWMSNWSRRYNHHVDACFAGGETGELS
jgi:hypothetical protein